jgi:hypothetical protein
MDQKSPRRLDAPGLADPVLMATRVTVLPDAAIAIAAYSLALCDQDDSPFPY